MKTTGLVLIALLVGAPGAARAQEPPTQPPPAQPPVTQPPVMQPPVTQPPATPPADPTAVPADALAPPPGRVALSDTELMRRRNAIYIMEGLLVNSVKLAASQTQTEIEAAQPELKVTLFTAVPPEARGNFLEDYGVFFQVLIPTYQPSVVSILNMLPPNSPRPQMNPAQPASATRDMALNPDAVYVEAVRQNLIDAMLDYSKGLDLRPNEWLTVAARGADGAPGPVSEPSVLILRVKGRDLIEFLSGRLNRDEVVRRVEVRGFSGRR